MTQSGALLAFCEGLIHDRFLHHAEIIAIEGKSYRLKDQACRKKLSDV